MESLENYNINFSKLKLGQHYFNYNPGDDFFANYENSLIEKCSSSVLVTLDKQKETLFSLNFHIQASVGLNCDRCLDDFNYPFNEEYQILVELKAAEGNEEEDNLVTLSEDEDEINIAQYLYEFISLSVPMKKTCDQIDKDCNPEVINILKKHQPKEDEIDPRWEELKKLYKNNN